MNALALVQTYIKQGSAMKISFNLGQYSDDNGILHSKGRPGGSSTVQSMKFEILVLVCQ